MTNAQFKKFMSYRDVRMYQVSPENLLCHLFAQKYLFPLFLGKPDGQTDRWAVREARRHLKMGFYENHRPKNACAGSHINGT